MMRALVRACACLRRERAETRPPLTSSLIRRHARLPPGSNWGGTIIQSWANNATNAACGITEGAANATLPAGAENNDALRFAAPGFEERVRAGPDPNHGYGVLYNAMIAPFALGPMSLSSMIWFQVSKSERKRRRECAGERASARTRARARAQARARERVRERV